MSKKPQGDVHITLSIDTGDNDKWFEGCEDSDDLYNAGKGMGVRICQLIAQQGQGTTPIVAEVTDVATDDVKFVGGEYSISVTVRMDYSGQYIDDDGLYGDESEVAEAIESGVIELEEICDMNYPDDTQIEDVEVVEN